ncbi:glycosyltransferase family 4 protein [Antrihabitans cavernicola]|nr:glycosyltransferase family 4 protein [Spelaeibacter cavernicola]
MAAVAAHALPRAAATWSQSKPMLSTLEREWKVPRNRLHYVPLGIDTDFYAVQPPPETGNVVASIGEDRFRNHQLLISAIRHVKRALPDTRLELATLLPVDLPAEYGTVIRERLYGRARDLYRRSTLVALALHPTITGSGLTVVLEAMSSGRPVVVTDNPGISEYVEHGVTGILVPSNDEPAFERAVTDLLSDPQRAAEMGRAAAQRVRERFTSKKMSERLAQILHSVG